MTGFGFARGTGGEARGFLATGDDAGGGEDPNFRFGAGDEGCRRSDFKRSLAGRASGFCSSSSEEPSLSFRIILKQSNIRLSRSDLVN